jgi:hypothetical protein
MRSAVLSCPAIPSKGGSGNGSTCAITLVKDLPRAGSVRVIPAFRIARGDSWKGPIGGAIGRLCWRGLARAARITYVVTAMLLSPGAHGDVHRLQ